MHGLNHIKIGIGQIKTTWLIFTERHRKNYKPIYSSQIFQTGCGPTHLSQQWVLWTHFTGMKRLGARLKHSLCRFQGKINLSSNPWYSHGQFHQSSKITNFLLYITRIIQIKWKILGLKHTAGKRTFVVYNWQVCSFFLSLSAFPCQLLFHFCSMLLCRCTDRPEFSVSFQNIDCCWLE